MLLGVLAQLFGLLRVEVALEPQKMREREVGPAAKQPLDDAVEDRAGHLVARDGRRVDVGDAGAVLRQQLLLDQVVHDRHDGRVGDLALLAERLVDVAHRRLLALPDDRENVGFERTDPREGSTLGALEPFRSDAFHAPAPFRSFVLPIDGRSMGKQAETPRTLSLP